MSPSSLPLFERAGEHGSRIALSDQSGDYSFHDLVEGSRRGAARLLDGSSDLAEGRVAFMVPPSFDYFRTQWAIWRAGGVAVPLCLTHPQPELAHALDTTRPTLAVGSSENREVLEPLAAERGIEYLPLDQLDAEPGSLPALTPDRRAMILFTSGTTGRPKGVVITHANLEAQITSLVAAWEWSEEDRILLNLPLHHIHGLVNVVGCALWSGAHCDTLPRFDAEEVAQRLIAGNLTLFMAVPTIYHRLVSWFDQATESDRQRLTDGCRDLRLMVSGSAALPVPVLERWREISGHTLLERYGMTEIGMALSNPLHGERLPGHVGNPLPGVKVRLAGGEDEPVLDGETGEIQVRGPNVFLEYFERHEDTEKAFAPGRWFRTGDTAVIDNDAYRILGRTSVDILKTGAEKVSALEVEEVLLGHPGVQEAAVVGIDDPEWGQRVAAATVVEDGITAEELTGWCRERLAPHKTPKDFHFVDALPRNPLGKTIKPRVVEIIEESTR